MIESEVEKYLRIKIKSIGGLCYKWVSPGNSGVPDRIVIYDGIVWFVELKRPNAKPRASQIACHDKLRSKGVKVSVLDSIDEVDDFIEELITYAKRV